VVLTVICCIGMITGIYKDCKADKFGDGYFMMILCIFPVAIMSAFIWYAWFIHFSSPIKIS